MRVAALYDIHGNLPALEAVLEDIDQDQFDQIVVGGDVVPGPMPRETLARLLDLEIPVQFIQGNGDREAVASMKGMELTTVPPAFQELVHWSARELQPEYEHFLASWPPTLRLQIGGIGEVLFCHATPRNDVEMFTRRTAEARLVPLFDHLGVSVVICGHTHMQFDRVIGSTRVVNAGSVGMSFEGPGAFWLSMGPDIQLRRTTYDRRNAADRIRATKYPQAEEFAARSVLQPPSADEMLNAFGPVELKEERPTS